MTFLSRTRTTAIHYTFQCFNDKNFLKQQWTERDFWMDNFPLRGWRLFYRIGHILQRFQDIKTEKHENITSLQIKLEPKNKEIKPLAPTDWVLFLCCMIFIFKRILNMKSRTFLLNPSRNYVNLKQVVSNLNGYLRESTASFSSLE